MKCHRVFSTLRVRLDQSQAGDQVFVLRRDVLLLRVPVSLVLQDAALRHPFQRREAEFFGTMLAAKEVIFIRELLIDLGIPVDAPSVSSSATPSPPSAWPSTPSHSRRPSTSCATRMNFATVLRAGSTLPSTSTLTPSSPTSLPRACVNTSTKPCCRACSICPTRVLSHTCACARGGAPGSPPTEARLPGPGQRERGIWSPFPFPPWRFPWYSVFVRPSVAYPVRIWPPPTLLLNKDFLRFHAQNPLI